MSENTKLEKVEHKAKSPLHAIAERLHADPEILKKTLISTCFKMKDRQATDEEFMALMIVANTYRLNPITKEIYAFVDKNGGIVPIVSTDGWNNIMTEHPDYKTHSYRYAEKSVVLSGAKPCPEWCEVDIEKKDGSHVVVREYLDEVFRVLNYVNPWQTHTKRMLRHKTKIQGAREAFGFSGIYDEDEGERILEAKDVKKVIEMPKRLSEKKVEVVEAAPVTQAEEAPPEAKEEQPAAESAPAPDARPLPEGFKLIKARYNGLCKAKECQKEIRVDDEVAYSKDKGIFHPDCAKK